MAMNNNYKNDPVFTVSLGRGQEAVEIDIYMHLEKVGGRFQSVSHICLGESHCGMSRHWLKMPAPAWYPDPRGNGINGSWNRRRDSLTTIDNKVDSLGAAILRAEQLLIQKLNFGLAFNNILAKPVYSWKRQDFENIGVTNSGFLDKILAACEESKPQKLRELVALKCGGFGQKSYEKAAEILGRLEINMGYKCRAL